ncbi:MAG: type II secretion system F family protein [Oligoflexia bacterium]|nr:type II secretion system F family protein [Oligoflexia bacterium]
MAIYRWDGINKEGKRVNGEDDAQNEREIRKILRGRNIRPIKIRSPSLLDIDIGVWLVEKGFAAPFNNDDLMNFTKQLSLMISAGVPIMQSLEIIYKQQKNATLKLSVKKISTAVGSGKSLSEAMAAEKGFDRLYCNLVKAGEAGGVLDTILNKLASHLEKQAKIKSQIKSALSYPIIVCVVGAAVVTAMLVFVVPMFVGMLKESGQQIPWITQFVIDASNFLGATWYILIIGGFVSLIVFMKWIKTDVGKLVWDNFIMKVPLFGSIVIKGSLSSVTRTLSTMLTSGVSLIDSLEICINTVDNKVISADMTKVKKEVEEGKTLVDPLLKISYFPDMVAQMVKVGEQTGNLDQMFERIADIFEKDVEETIGAVTKLIEPLILVVLGGIVATILVAMYMPIFMSAGGAG